MLDFAEPPLTVALSDGLTMRTVACEADLERVAVFNGLIHGSGVAPMTRNLFLYHPNTRPRDLVFVEVGQTGEILSSLCLIPWTWHLEGVSLAAGEMGIVGTLESHRRRGLVRSQVAFFKQRLAERGCLLSHIQGIAYYYRQFGYEYALPLEGGRRLEYRDIPGEPATGFSFRWGTEEDVAALAELYDAAANDLAIHAARDGTIWRYLLTRTQGSEMAIDFLLVLAADGGIVGYVALPQHHFGAELVVSESSRFSFEAGLATLQHLQQLGLERSMPAIRLNLPVGDTLMRLATSFGAHDLGTYAWQIHIPDFVALLSTLAPTLERRIQRSPFSGLTRELRIGLYRQTISLRFADGRLAEVVALAPAGPEAVRLPPNVLTLLVLGHHTADELRASYPDVSVSAIDRLLVETLFPRLSAFIYTNY